MSVFDDLRPPGGWHASAAATEPAPTPAVPPAGPDPARPADGSRSWEDRAACIDADPGVFFPDKLTAALEAAAKRVCAVCGVREDCLNFALADPSLDHGVWGGMTPKERRLERRQRRLAQAAVA